MSWRTRSWALVFGVWAAVPTSAVAQSDFHHVHLTVSDAEEAAQWYITHMECEPVEGSANRALCGSVLVLFFEGDALGPSQGTGVDHISFSFDDLDAKHASLEAAGVSLREDGVREVPGLFKVPTPACERANPDLHKRYVSSVTTFITRSTHGRDRKERKGWQHGDGSIGAASSIT